MAENLVSSLIVACFGPNLVPPNFFVALPLLDVLHYCKLSLDVILRKTTEPNLRTWHKTQFQEQFWLLWPKFGFQKKFSWILPPLDVKHVRQAIIVCNLEKNNELNMRKWQKNLVLGPLLAQLAQIRATKRSGSFSH